MSDPCTEKCWTKVPCPECGRLMPPAGRSVPMATPPCHCSEKYVHTKINTCHLWNRHDSSRVYTDPEGWKQHVEECEACREE